MATIPQQEEQRLKLLEQIEAAEKRINAQNEKIAVSKAKEAKRLEKVMEAEKKSLDTLKDELRVTEKLLSTNQKRSETLKKQAQFKKEILEDSENELTSFSKLSSRVKVALTDEESKYSALASVATRIREINTEILLIKTDGKRFTDADREAAVLKRNSLMNEKETLKENRDKLIKQVESYLDIEDSTKGMSQAAKDELEFKESIKDFDTETQKIFIDMFKQRQLFLAQEKRIGEIQEQQKKMYDAIPDSLKPIIEGAGKFLKISSGIVFAWAAAATIFAFGVKAMTDMSDASKKFKQETGIINSQMKDIKKVAASVTSEMALMGVEFEGVFDTISEIKKQFGDVANLSKDTVRALTVLSTNFGVAAEDSAEFVGQLEAMTGLSEDTAVNYALQVTNVAKLSKIAPKQLFKDIAEAAKDSAEYFGSGFDNMAKTAIEARRLGTTLKEVMGVSEKLLDFESGIEQELKAAAFAQGQFNLTQARTLAANKDYSGALDEVLNQMERNGRFADKDLFTQRELAKAVGETPATIQRLIAQRERLVHLGDEDKKLAQQAIANGLDITNASKEDLDLTIQKLKADQQMQGELSKIKNTFAGIGMQLGTAILPILELMLVPVSLMAEGFAKIAQWNEALGGSLGYAAMILGSMFAIQKGIVAFKKLELILQASSIKKEGALAAVKALSNPARALAGVIAAGVIVGAASRYMNAGDMNSPAEGQTTVSTKEGGLFKLSKNDDLIAAPGASTALANAANGGGGAGMQAMANVIAANTKAMERLNSGGIPVNTYLGTSKVNDLLTGYQSKTTRNNFNI